METDETPMTHDERMERYALRSTKALEALQQFALWWTVLFVLGALIWLIYAVKAGS